MRPKQKVAYRLLRVGGMRSYFYTLLAGVLSVTIAIPAQLLAGDPRPPVRPRFVPELNRPPFETYRDTVRGLGIPRDFHRYGGAKDVDGARDYLAEKLENKYPKAEREAFDQEYAPDVKVDPSDPSSPVTVSSSGETFGEPGGNGFDDGTRGPPERPQAPRSLPGAHSMHTIWLILAASAYDMWKEHRTEVALKGRAQADKTDDGQQKFCRIRNLSSFDAQTLRVPLAPDGGLYLGPAKTPWVNFDSAPDGWAEVVVLAQGRVVRVERLLDADRKPLSFSPIFHFLENPGADVKPDSSVPARSLKECDNPHHLKRWIEIDRPTLTASIEAAIPYVVNADLIHAMVGTGAWQYPITRKMLGQPLQRFAGWVSKPFGRAVLGTFISSGASMAVTFPVWEAMGHLTEMARGLIRDPEVRERTKNLFGRRFADLSLCATERKNGSGVGAIFCKEYDRDIFALGRLWENMGLILMNQDGMRDRGIAGIFRERLLTTDFLLLLGALSASGIVQQLGLQGFQAGWSAATSHEVSRPSLKTIQTWARKSGDTLSSSLQQAGLRKNHFKARITLGSAKRRAAIALAEAEMKTLERAGIRVLAGDAALLMGRFALRAFWVTAVFILCLDAINLMPQEHRNLATAIPRKISIDLQRGGIDLDRRYLKSLLTNEASEQWVRTQLASMRKRRESIVDELNFLRNMYIVSIQQREYENYLLVQRARGESKDWIGSVGGTWEELWNKTAVNGTLTEIRERDELIAPTREALLFYASPALLDLYEDEINWLTGKEMLDLPSDTLPMFLHEGARYDMFEGYVRSYAAKFGAHADNITAYAVSIFMLRNHTAERLRAAPEHLWKEEMAWGLIKHQEEELLRLAESVGIAQGDVKEAFVETGSPPAPEDQKELAFRTTLAKNRDGMKGETSRLAKVINAGIALMNGQAGKWVRAEDDHINNNRASQMAEFMLALLKRRNALFTLLEDPNALLTRWKEIVVMLRESKEGSGQYPWETLNDHAGRFSSTWVDPATKYFQPAPKRRDVFRDFYEMMAGNDPADEALMAASESYNQLFKEIAHPLYGTSNLREADEMFVRMYSEEKLAEVIQLGAQQDALEDLQFTFEQKVSAAKSRAEAREIEEEREVDQRFEALYGSSARDRLRRIQGRKQMRDYDQAIEDGELEEEGERSYMKLFGFRELEWVRSMIAPLREKKQDIKSFPQDKTHEDRQAWNALLQVKPWNELPPPSGSQVVRQPHRPLDDR